jgi:hypothetical protein
MRRIRKGRVGAGAIGIGDWGGWKRGKGATVPLSALMSCAKCQSALGAAGGPDYKEEVTEEDAKEVMVTEGQQTYLVVVGNGGGGDGLHDLREHERGGDRGRFVFFSRSCYSPLLGSFFFFFFLSRTTRARNRDVDSGGVFAWMDQYV